MKLASPRFTRYKCVRADTVNRNARPETAFACIPLHQVALEH